MISKDKINSLILNYFIQEGYQDAAILFAHDTGVDLNDATPIISHPQAVGYNTIKQRTEIKLLILNGSIAQAIHKISECFPMVLDRNNLLHFKLLRLNLIEMIREHKLGGDIIGDSVSKNDERSFLQHILLFVRQNLINKVSQSLALLKELEITMSLLCFKFDPLRDVLEQRDLPQQLRLLFDLSLRNQCYRLVNSAILNLHELPEEVYRGPQYPDVEFDLTGNFEDDFDDDDIEFEVEYNPTGAIPITAEQDPSSFPPEPTSKLERIIMLYALTEQRLVDLQVTREVHGILILP